MIYVAKAANWRYFGKFWLLPHFLMQGMRFLVLLEVCFITLNTNAGFLF